MTTISSAQRTDSRAAAILAASLYVMTVTVSAGMLPATVSHKTKRALRRAPSMCRRAVRLSLRRAAQVVRHRQNARRTAERRLLRRLVVDHRFQVVDDRLQLAVPRLTQVALRLD